MPDNWEPRRSYHRPNREEHPQKVADAERKRDNRRRRNMKMTKRARYNG